jgi:hypothetical protein
MKMIGQKHKPKHRYLLALARTLEQGEELAPVAIVAKHLLPFIAARAEVIDRILKLDAQGRAMTLVSQIKSKLSNTKLRVPAREIKEVKC